MKLQLSVGKIKNYGFTVVEIMLVVAIIALLMTAAVPSLESMLRNNQSMSIASKLVASLRLAKAEAIKRGIPVTVCPINPAFTVSAAFNEAVEQWPCQNSTNWTAWKVMTDPGFNATENFSDGWPVLQYVGNNPTGTISSNLAGPITFDPMGFANIQPATTRSGWTWSSSYSSGEWQWSNSYVSAYGGTYYRVFTVTPAGCTGKNARAIEVTQNGVITISNVAC